MKKILGILVAIVTLLCIALIVFKRANGTSVMSNQASFEIYFDTNGLSVDRFFNLPEGSFDPEKHIIICKLPVDVQGFKAKNAIVRQDLSNIDCNAEYTEGRDVKYDATELNNSYFEFLAVNKHGRNLQMFDERMGAASILAKRPMPMSFSKGKINRLVVSKSGVYEFCNE